MANTPSKKHVTITFRHGLGDTVHFAHQLPLYIKRGFEIEVICNSDREILFKESGVTVAHRADDGERIAWDHPPCAQHIGALPIWTENKACFNLGRNPMPQLTDVSREELWKEFLAVKLDLGRHVTVAAWKCVDEFLAPLPHPIILLHTIGNSFQQEKSLPKDETETLYSSLIHDSNGALVLLDWDDRVPKIPHFRIRHLTDDWERIDIERLIALQFKSDLLIGIDSGPLHLARITGIPALGVFPNEGHWPSRYVLPRDSQAIIVPRSSRVHPNRLYRSALNLIETESDTVAGSFIARHALRMLERPRYSGGMMGGADLQLQHFVRDKIKGESGALSQIVDRNRSMDILFREMCARFNSPVVVETGTIRAEEDWTGAGFSTYIFASLLRSIGGKLISIDRDNDNCAFAKSLTAGLCDVEIVNEDSLTALARITDTIDVLYIDSMDTTEAGHADHALLEISSVMGRLSERAIIAIDDTVYGSREFHGKGALAVPWLQHAGWKILYSGYQTLLSRTV